MILGAILAGGRSRRFGSDKALALLEGETLLDHVLARLRPQVDALLLCGRAVADLECVADRPGPDLGPLGGLNAALHHAQEHGFDAVVSVPCDVPRLPPDLAACLRTEPGATYAAALPVIGYWPVALAALLDRHLATSPDRSMRRWATLAEARPVALAPLANLNTPDDLERLAEKDLSYTPRA